MSVFGWSLPPGGGSLPGAEEQPIDLRDGDTLKGYGGRRHGLCGKDADLDEGGQVIGKEAWWHEDGTIEIRCRYYATIVPTEEYEFQADEEAEALRPVEQAAYDGYMDSCSEFVAGAGYSGEWTGNDWSLGGDLHIRENFDWDDDKSEGQNVEAATDKAYDLIMDHADVKAFQQEMAQCSQAMDKWASDRSGPAD
jgi:hypothetical protein